MGNNGFFKGEKKKQKKRKAMSALQQQNTGQAVFIMPEVIKKKQ